MYTVHCTLYTVYTSRASLIQTVHMLVKQTTYTGIIMHGIWDCEYVFILERPDKRGSPNVMGKAVYRLHHIRTNYN